MAERNTSLVIIPLNKIEDWTNKYINWNNFVMESYHSRLKEMLDIIDTFAFMSMDGRLLQYLQDKTKIN